jgi:hypothetical protein
MPRAGPSGVARTWALRVGKPEGPRGAVYRLPAGERRMGWAPWLVAKAHPSGERWGSERRKGQVVLPETQAGRMKDGTTAARWAVGRVTGGAGVGGAGGGSSGRAERMSAMHRRTAATALGDGRGTPQELAKRARSLGSSRAKAWRGPAAKAWCSAGAGAESGWSSAAMAPATSTGGRTWVRGRALEMWKVRAAMCAAALRAKAARSEEA